MPTLDTAALLAAFIVLAEFFCLALLGWLLLKLIAWEAAFKENRDGWLCKLHREARSLRRMRRQLDRTSESLQHVALPLVLRRKWLIAHWALRAFQLGKMARS